MSQNCGVGPLPASSSRTVVRQLRGGAFARLCVELKDFLVALLLESATFFSAGWPLANGLPASMKALPECALE